MKGWKIDIIKLHEGTCVQVFMTATTAPNLSVKGCLREHLSYTPGATLETAVKDCTAYAVN